MRRGRVQRLMEWPPLVAIYESRLWRRSTLFARATGIRFEAELATLQEHARLAADARVLDLACGSGIYSRPLARAVPRGRVVGLDLSRPMLRQARRRASRERLDHLSWLRGDALALPFRDASFELVNCCGALHLFADVPAALAETYRVLRPGGRLTAAVMRRGEGAAAERRAARREARLGVHSFGRKELERRLEAAGFRDLHFPHEHGIWMLAVALRPR